MIGRFENFSLGLSQLTSAWNKIANEELKPFGLKGRASVYMIALYKSEEGLTGANLSEICHRDKAEVSRVISEMAKKGLVVKEQGTGNGYRAKIRLTEAGKKATYELRERIKLAVEKGGQGLSDEERDHFYLALQVIAKNLTDISEKGL